MRPYPIEEPEERLVPTPCGVCGEKIGWPEGEPEPRCEVCLQAAEIARLRAELEEKERVIDALAETFPVEGERIGQYSPAIKHIRADFWGVHRSLWKGVAALSGQALHREQP